jgi:hypothetical protein
MTNIVIIFIFFISYDIIFDVFVIFIPFLLEWDACVVLSSTGVCLFGSIHIQLIKASKQSLEFNSLNSIQCAAKQKYLN